MGFVPRLRTVLLLVNLMILVLPIAGIVALRLYENELVRSTETELIAQGVILSVAFKENLLPLLTDDNPEYGELAKDYGIPLSPENMSFFHSSKPYSPIIPKLDLFDDTLYPPALPATPPKYPPNPLAIIAGEKIIPLLLAAKRHNLCGIRVMDYNGVVVATTGSEFGLSLADRWEVRRGLKGAYFSLLRQRISDEPMPPLESISRRARVRVFSAIPVTHGDRVLGLVVLSRTPLDILKAIYQNQSHLLTFAASLLIIVLLVSIFTSRTISLPVKRLIRQAKAVASGDQTAAVPLKKPGTREVAELSESFTHMAKTLHERAEYISTFASHVSHEFKSPLASIRGTVELLEDHLLKMSVQDREKFLNMIDADAERLERLVGKLLEMAKADVLQTGNEQTKVAPVIDGLALRFNQGGLSVTVDYDKKVEKVKMAPGILESIMTTLLENAKQHGGGDVGVHISTTLQEFDSEDKVEILIVDDGPGISKANEKRIFTPFFTTAKDKGGSGLGLSIAMKLVEAHGGNLSYVKSDPGAKFIISLPAC